MNEKIKQYSRDLRNNSTTGEITLWSKVLRAKKMYGYQFNRQFVIEYYIVDFVCRKLKLIIEVDGYSHNFKFEKDKKRDERLCELGYTVLRFTEYDIKRNFNNNEMRAIESFILEEESPQPPFPKGE